MKYFILFKSGRLASAVKIQSNHPYENNKYSYMVDDTEYCYADRTYDCETVNYYKPRISYTVPTFYVYRPENGCWFVDRDIKYIVVLDEEENEDMNKVQSTDFNAGMMYAKIERDTYRLIDDYEKGKRSVYTNSYQFTTSQLFPDANYSAKEKSYIVDAIKKTVENQFNRVYGHYYALQFSDFPGGSYCVFVYTITRKEEVKELTIAEIEEKLGYKIKVVGE